MESPKHSDDRQENDRCAQVEREVSVLRNKLNRLTRIEQEHARQTAFMSQLVELVPFGIAVHTDGVATFVNPAGLTMIGAKSEDEVLGKSVITLVHPEHRPQALERIRRLIAHQPSNHTPIAPYIKEKFLRLDGETIDVEVAAFPLQKNDPTSIFVLFRDVTEEKRQQQEIKEKEHRLHQLISLLPEATIIHRDGIIIFANQTALSLLGLASEDEIIGHSVFEFLHPDEYEGVRARIKQIQETSLPLPQVNERIVRKDGGMFLAEINAIPFEEAGESAVLLVMRDVTAREKLLKALERSEAKFRMLAELLPAFVFMIDEKGSLLYINSAPEAIFGRSLGEAIATSYWKHIDPDSLQNAASKFDALELGENANFELQLNFGTESPFWVDVWVTKTILDDHVVGLGVAMDITWRKKTEAILKLQAQKLVQAHEDERESIARELHDEIGQQLIGMKFALERAQHFARDAKATDAIQNARQILTDLTESVRELSLSFRPPMLNDLGLLPTLLWHFERYAKNTGIQVQFSQTGLDKYPVPNPISIAAFRIIQESLTNVARHARVDVVYVTIDRDDDRLQIIIRDNGVGFDWQKIQTSYLSSGIPGMIERVELLGGKLQIKSVQGEGTTISASIPLFDD